MQITEAIIAVSSVLAMVFFLIYVVGLLRMPTGHRPKTRTIDRYGHPLPPTENPGYAETEEERQR